MVVLLASCAKTHVGFQRTCDVLSQGPDYARCEGIQLFFVCLFVYSKQIFVFSFILCHSCAIMTFCLVLSVFLAFLCFTFKFLHSAAFPLLLFCLMPSAELTAFSTDFICFPLFAFCCFGFCCFCFPLFCLQLLALFAFVLLLPAGFFRFMSSAVYIVHA